MRSDSGRFPPCARPFVASFSPRLPPLPLPLARYSTAFFYGFTPPVRACSVRRGENLFLRSPRSNPSSSFILTRNLSDLPSFISSSENRADQPTDAEFSAEAVIDFSKINRNARDATEESNRPWYLNRINGSSSSGQLVDGAPRNLSYRVDESPSCWDACLQAENFETERITFQKLGPSSNSC